MTAKEWLDIVKRNPVAFGWEAGFKDLTELHNGWIKSFLLAKTDQTLQAHRGSYKTTCLAIAIALMLIVYPQLIIMFTRKTDDDVKEIILQIAKMLRSDMFQALAYGLWQKNILLTRESAFEIDTNLKASPRGSSQLIGMGSKGSMTGKHGDIIITDDIINLQDRISPAERERTKLFYQELQNIKNRDGRIINTGTPWHKEDAFSLMGEIQKYSVYDTGLLSAAEIDSLRQKMTPSLFAANYELKHIADADAMFTAPNMWKGEQDAIYNGIGHIDAAYGGNDGTAFTVIRETGCGELVVLGKLWDKHVDDCLDEILILHEHYRVGTIFCESNADKGYLRKQIKERGVPCQNYHENRNKFIKISTSLRSSWERIYFVEGTDPEYLQQILDYTENAAHDDAPDSLATAILVRNGHTVKLKTFKGGI